jgi:molybdenum cofactor biosynthesis enzyme MoaA
LDTSAHASEASSTSTADGVLPAPPRIWALPVSHASSGVRYRPEDNPFHTVFADVTHRCNMSCRNCYIPNRDVPDMPAEWLYDMLRRLPRRTRIRLVGAEPTMRKDLPELIRRTRELGHTPVVLSNGLKLANRRYVETLKRAGLRTIYLSCNGGLEDDLYEAIDDLRCAKQKRAALGVLARANMHVTVGMILVRGVNTQHWPVFFEHLRAIPQVTEIHLRSIGQFGRHMAVEPLSMQELIDCAMSAVAAGASCTSSAGDIARGDLVIAGKRIDLKQWPELGSSSRGRMTPDGYVEPCFEHLIANQGGY